jgi:thymidine kinase
MFSGKTEELLRRIRRAMIARQPTVLVKPKIDQRFSANDVVSHDQRQLPSISLATASEILDVAKDALVVGIDEAQFFDEALVEVCEKLADQGKRVIVAALDQDYRGEPFHPIPRLISTAEYVTKQLAICAQCGAPANRNQRLIETEGQVLVGAAEAYEARCRRCFRPPEKG